MLRNINPDDFQYLWNIFISDRGPAMGQINQQDVYLDMEPDLNYELSSKPYTVGPQLSLKTESTVLPSYNINVRHNNTGDLIRVTSKDSTFTIGDSMIRRVLDTVYYNQTTGETTTEKP